jgi:hypothetical protein
MHAAHFLDQLEKIVGSIDLVDFAGLGVSDDDARPIHPPGMLQLRRTSGLGIMLGAKIRMIEAGRFLEHVLAKRALIQTGRRNRGCVVKTLGLDRLGKLDGVAGAVDIGRLVVLLRSAQVVDRRQVEKVLDLAAEPVTIGITDAQSRLGQVTMTAPPATLLGPALTDQFIELLFRARRTRT